MAIGAAGDGLFHNIFEGCISGSDMGIQRRPYHRNCNCYLHKSSGQCSHSLRRSKVSYPIRRTWSEGNLALMPSPPTQLSPSLCSSSLATFASSLARAQTCLTLSDQE